ncbi:hypothetical protein OIU77_020362 [Salix suchowensis]|uniref:Uncharacterized protein n=1 Tax=Salix suchowensis TaxID=1278906 RepID=A0ABQ9CNC3_9ROSI|nr:hypothetical protein OIU77_020362 [Salix suchowensis]
MVDGLIVIWLQLGDPGHLCLMDVRDQLPRTLQVCKPPEGTYVGSFGYQQPVPYGYQQGLMYHPYGNAKSGSCNGYVPQLNVC